MAKTKSTQPVVVRREVFLALLQAAGTITKACKLAKIPRATIYEWRAADPEFAKAIEATKEMAADGLEDSLYVRGHEGVEVPIFSQGRKVGTKREYDTTAAIFLLNGMRPEKYRQRGTLDVNLIPNLPARLDAAEKRLLKDVKDSDS